MHPLYFTTIPHAVNEQWTLPMGTFFKFIDVIIRNDIYKASQTYACIYDDMWNLCEEEG